MVFNRLHLSRITRFKWTRSRGTQRVHGPHYVGELCLFCMSLSFSTRLKRLRKPLAVIETRARLETPFFFICFLNADRIVWADGNGGARTDHHDAISSNSFCSSNAQQRTSTVELNHGLSPELSIPDSDLTFHQAGAWLGGSGQPRWPILHLRGLYGALFRAVDCRRLQVRNISWTDEWTKQDVQQQPVYECGKSSNPENSE